MTLEYTVKIDGIEYEFISLEYSSSLEFTPSRFRIELPDIYTDIHPYSEVTIYRNGSLVFKGYITNIHKEIGSRGKILVIEGLDNKIKLKERVLGASKSIGSEPANLIKALIIPMVEVSGRTGLKDIVVEDNGKSSGIVTIYNSGTGNYYARLQDDCTTDKYSGANSVKMDVYNYNDGNHYKYTGIKINLNKDLSGFYQLHFYAKRTEYNGEYLPSNWTVKLVDNNGKTITWNISIGTTWTEIRLLFREGIIDSGFNYSSVSHLLIYCEPTDITTGNTPDCLFDLIEFIGTDWTATSNVLSNPNLTIDGNMWSKAEKGSIQSSGDYLQIDFGRTVIGLCRIVIEHESNKYAENYKLQYSSDGSTWNDIVSVSGNSLRCIDHTFNPVDCRYIRIYITSNGTKEWSIYEVYPYIQLREPYVDIGQIDTYGYPVYGQLTNYSLVINALNRISQYIGWELKLSPDDKLYFKSQIGSDLSGSIVLEEGVNVMRIELEKDVLETYDKITVLGSGEGLSALTSTKTWTHSDSIMWCELEEETGTIIYDLIHSSITGSIVGSNISRSLEDKGRGYIFPATTTDYIDMGSHSEYDIGQNSYTFIALFKMNGTYTDFQYPLAKMGVTNIYIAGDLSSYGMNIYDGSSWHTYTVSESINTGEYHVLIGIYDRTNNLVKIYLDGVEKLSETATYNLGDSTNSIYIGYQFNGWIGNAIIIKKALSKDEVYRITTMLLNGRRHGLVVEKDITSLETLDKRATVLLDYYSKPKYSITIKPIAETLWFDIGDTIRIKSARLGVDNKYRVLKYTRRYSINGEELNLVVGDIDIRFTSTIQDIERQLSEIRQFFGGLPSLIQMQGQDEIDSGHPIYIRLRIPDELRDFQYLYLDIWGEPFRARSKSALSGGGTTVTSASGGGTTVTSGGGSTTTTSSAGGGTTVTSAVPPSEQTAEVVTDITTEYKDLLDCDSNCISVLHITSHTTEFFPTKDHTHTVDIPNHTHDVDMSKHTHKVTIPAHTHLVEIPDHIHDIDFGIYEGSYPENVTVYLIAPDNTTWNLGNFGSGSLAVREIDIASIIAYKGYMSGEWTIKITSTKNGRIRWNIFGLAYLGVRVK